MNHRMHKTTKEGANVIRRGKKTCHADLHQSLVDNPDHLVTQLYHYLYFKCKLYCDEHNLFCKLTLTVVVCTLMTWMWYNVMRFNLCLYT